MKILIVRTFPNFIDPHQYNMQEIGLAKALIRKGHECGIVLYYGKNKDEVEKIPVLCDGMIKNITVYRLHGYNILKNGFFPSLKKVVKEYDVIQVHEYDQLTSWMYYAWSKKPIVIYHGPYYHKFNKGYNLKCKIFDNTFLKIKHNKQVLCMVKSELAAEFLRCKGFMNIKTVGVGLDLDNFAGENIAEKEDFPVDESKFNIIYVGKIEERRNPIFLLKVMEKLCERNTIINCIIVGNGEKGYVKEFLQKADGLLKSGRLQYYEKASQNQLAHLYKKAQLMLFPSFYDIYGMVLLEAVYFGLPVITSRNGGSDIIQEQIQNGKVAEKFDVFMWINLVEEFMKSWNKNASNIDVRKENVSWDSIVDRFIESYEKVFIGRGR